jgi:hypothetical protein
MSGVGRRLDGVANRELNLGALIALGADLTKLASMHNTDQQTLRSALVGWGRGNIDPHFSAGDTGARQIPDISGNAEDWQDARLTSHWNGLLGPLGAAPAR